MMAADSGPSSDSERNINKSDEADEKLDLFSEKFDPVAFLYSDKAKIPKPDAKVFDNLSIWNSHFERGGDLRAGKKEKKPEESKLPERKWLPHQLPIQSKRLPNIRKDVFTKMNSVQGPLALLRKYVEEKTRIKIITRNEKGIRGYCIAYLLAFDKHFNFILEEVNEVWRRSITVKKDAMFLGVNDEADTNNTKKISRNWVKLPEIVTKKISKNTEECKRYVDQMLMRGEHVVMVCVASEQDKNIS